MRCYERVQILSPIAGKALSSEYTEAQHLLFQATGELKGLFENVSASLPLVRSVPLEEKPYCMHGEGRI